MTGNALNLLWCVIILYSSISETAYFKIGALLAVTSTEQTTARTCTTASVHAWTRTRIYDQIHEPVVDTHSASEVDISRSLAA